MTDLFSTPAVSAVSPISTPNPSPNPPGSAPVVPAPTPSQPSLSVAPTSISQEPDLRSASLYLNRELSWLEFNARVLSEADSESVPLLERLKFFAIVASNLDEFFMVRVAGLKQQLTGEVGEIPPDGMTVSEQLAAIAAPVHDTVNQQNASLTAPLLPKLAHQGIGIV